jgi:hypothetical protein
MKHLGITVFVGSLFLFGIQQATFAQGQEVPYSEVSRMEQTASELRHSIPYRLTLTAESFPERDKEPSWKGISVLETVPPDRSHEIHENTAQGKSDRRELFSIAGKYYQRFNGGPWQVRRPPPPPPIPASIGLAASPAGSRPKVETKAWLIETLIENGRLVYVYESKGTATREVDGKEVTQIATSRYWFRDDGMLLKKVAELEIVGDPKIVKNTTVYEYGDIKIEEPIINK